MMLLKAVLAVTRQNVVLQEALDLTGKSIHSFELMQFYSEKVPIENYIEHIRAKSFKYPQKLVNELGAPISVLGFVKRRTI